MDSSLLHTLQSLEVELHHPGSCCSAERVEQLLHPEFHEVGRSGTPYTRDTVIRFLAAMERPPAVASSEFQLSVLARDVALLTYRSARCHLDGTYSGHTLRSSLWLRTDAGWQLRYHQGTPAAGTW